jgi:hypothetical protein
MPSGQRDPHVKSAKVRIALNKKGEPRKRLPKRPIEKLDGDTLQRQSTIYLKERNATMRLRRMREGMRLALDRNELISKELAVKQLSYLCIVFRQKLLAMPQVVGTRVAASRRDQQLAKEVAGLVRDCVHEVLHVLSDLPLKVTDPDWMKKVEED